MSLDISRALSNVSTPRALETSKKEEVMRHRHGWHRARRHGFGQAFGFWGGAPPSRFFGPGELRLALLSLLSEGPRHGYELMRELESRSGGLYRASAGSVYPTLQQLEDEGLARSEAVDGKRVYRLTPEGESEVRQEEDTIRRIWRRAERWDEWSGLSRPDVWELARPARQLARAVLRAMARSDRDPDRIDEVRRILERARREIERLDDAGETRESEAR
jgi:DNA-binding PadR family transcriptional regulator